MQVEYKGIIITLGVISFINKNSETPSIIHTTGKHALICETGIMSHTKPLLFFRNLRIYRWGRSFLSIALPRICLIENFVMQKHYTNIMPPRHYIKTLFLLPVLLTIGYKYVIRFYFSIYFDFCSYITVWLCKYYNA